MSLKQVILLVLGGIGFVVPVALEYTVPDFIPGGAAGAFGLGVSIFVFSVCLNISYSIEEKADKKIQQLVRLARGSANEAIFNIMADVSSELIPLKDRPLCTRYIKRELKLTIDRANNIHKGASFSCFQEPKVYFRTVFENLLNILQKGDRWYTLSNLELWSRKNIDVTAFLKTNRSAASKGVIIERCLILPKEPLMLSDDDLSVLHEYCKMTLSDRYNRIKTWYKVAQKNYKEIIENKGNYAILKSGNDALMISIEYDYSDDRPLTLKGMSLVASRGEIDKDMLAFDANEKRSMIRITSGLKSALKNELISRNLSTN